MRTPGNCADERPVPHWLCRLHRDARLSAAGRDHGCDGVVLPQIDRRTSPGALGLCLCSFVGIDPSAALSVSLALSAGSTLGIVLLAPLLSSAFAGHPRLKRVVGDPIAHRRLSLGDSSHAAGALLPAAGPLAAAGQSGRKSSVRPGMPCRIRRRARRLSRSCRRAVAHRRCQHSLRAAVPRRGCPRVAFGHLPSHRRRPFGGRSTLLRALPRTVGLVAASEHQGPDGGGNRRRPNPRSASFSLRHGPDAINSSMWGQRRCFIAQRRNVLLIDTGNQDALLKAALARQRVGRLDAVAVTHSDDDHCGSLPVLGDVAPAAALLVPEGLPACGCRACAELMEVEAEGSATHSAVELSLGDTVRCVAIFTMRWRCGWERLAEEGGNADKFKARSPSGTAMAGWRWRRDGPCSRRRRGRAVGSVVRQAASRRCGRAEK